MRAVVLLPDAKITDEQLSQALAYGATTLGLETDFDGCMRLVAALADERRVYLLNSRTPCASRARRRSAWRRSRSSAGACRTGSSCPSATRATSRRSARACGSGSTLGVITKKPRLAGVQADAADPFYRSYRGGFTERVTRIAGDTAASAIRIGAPVSHPKARREIRFFGGVVERVTEAELLDAFALANRHGLAICPNSAVALAGAAKLRAGGRDPEGRPRRRRRDRSRAQVLGRRCPRITGAAAACEPAAAPSGDARRDPRGAGVREVPGALEATSPTWPRGARMEAGPMKVNMLEA